jgi:hypothetical protein
MKQCPFCLGEIRDEAIKCKYCKSMIVSATSDATQSCVPSAHPTLPGSPAGSMSDEQNSAQAEAPKEQSNQRKGVKAGIGGWLLFFVISLMFGCLDAVRKILEFLLAADPFRIQINKLIFGSDILVLFFALYAVYFLIMKKEIASTVYILFRLLSLSTGFLVFYGMDNSKMQFTNEKNIIYIQTFGELIGCLVIIPYFLLSKRVQVTFVNKLNREFFLDRLWMPLLPMLEKLHAFLWKTRKFIIFEVIGFIVVTMIITHGFVIMAK